MQTVHLLQGDLVSYPPPPRAPDVGLVGHDVWWAHLAEVTQRSL